MARTAITLLVAALSAAIGYALYLPIWILLGPAIGVSIAGFLGLRMEVDERVRDAAFLFIGIGIGSGVTPDAARVLVQAPPAFAVLTLTLIAVIWASRRILRVGFGQGDRTALLASSPGHLSFVLGLGSDTGANVGAIAVIQSIRLLALTVTAPFVALAFGIEMDRAILPPGPVMAVLPLLSLLGGALALGWLFRRWGWPAPFLLAAMALSALTHVSSVTHGGLHPQVAMVAFLVMGALIGSRSSGMGFGAVRRLAGAGLCSFLATIALTAPAAFLVAYWLEMPASHVFVSFAPGGLETMVAMGALLGANPSFVAATHVWRLFLLSFLVPLLLSRAGPED